MGKYSADLSVRLRRALKPFRKVNIEDVFGSRDAAIKRSNTPGYDGSFYDYYKDKEHW